MVGSVDSFQKECNRRDPARCRRRYRATDDAAEGGSAGPARRHHGLAVQTTDYRCNEEADNDVKAHKLAGQVTSPPASLHANEAQRQGKGCYKCVGILANSLGGHPTFWLNAVLKALADR